MNRLQVPDEAASVGARAWRNAAHEAVCDLRTPWAHGTVVRATRHPTYWDYNSVRVEDDPAMGVDELIAFADEALAGLPHRRMDFDRIDAATSLRAEFEDRGWNSERLVWMRHDEALPDGPDVAVEEVPYDATRDLRFIWHREDFPDQDPAAHEPDARAVAIARGAQTLAVKEAGTPIGLAQLVHDGTSAEITQVFVHPDHRGAGLGTAVTRAAIEAASDAHELWIVANDEDRPKNLYARLGFRPAWRTMEFLRLPSPV
jgi:GNAT superfamily N-acetyltransferase